MQGNIREGRVERDPPSYYRRLLRRPLKPYAVPMTIGVMCLLVSGGKVGTGNKAPGVSDEAQLTFLKEHWQVPIPPQGKPPARFSSLEASLDPESCAVCHRLQYDDWKGSLHSKSMGPGVMGQTLELIHDDPATALLCYGCHAPLTEQQERSRREGETRPRFRRNSAFLASLQAKGVTCTGCHVRKHQRFGPPRRDGSLENSLPASQIPHGGAIRSPAFERAEFCKACHQFQPDGYALNGKLLENTYHEWKEGPHGREKRPCQSCHMPDRRHLWRGIHDPEMVKQGVTVRLTLERKRYQVGDQVQAEVTLANTGVGHYFPTYVTPKVVVRFELVDEKGRGLEGSFLEERVGREVTLDLSQELFDTRIPPGKSHSVSYARTISQSGLRLKASIVVSPDDFYIRFFEAKLREAKMGKARDLLHEALGAARKSSFLLFEEEVVLS